VPLLEDIKGISDKTIRDSLQQASKRVPRFTPRKVNGKPEPSLYFLKIQLPVTYTPTVLQTYPSSFHYKKVTAEDFEFYHKSGQRLDVVFGGLLNSRLGRPGDYLATGGGIKVKIIYTGLRGLGASMVMNLYGNRLKQPYPITSTRTQNGAPPTLLLGAGLTKQLAVQEGREFMLQLDLTYAVQNVTPKEGETDKDWTQLKGISPGVSANYVIKIGNDHISTAYGTPPVLNHYLNMHAGLRPLLLNLKQAIGLMVEFGLAYRMGFHTIDEYKLKQ
jgi:hypothetical protein